MKRLQTLFVVAALAALPAAADIRYTTRTSSGGDTPNSQMNMVAEGWVDGERAQIYFRESSNPWMKTGTYLYTPDAGRTLFLVDPEQKTYSEWDLEAILRFAGSVLRGMGPLLKFEVQDPEVKLVSEGPGPALLGLPTTEYELHSSYTMLVKVLGFKNQQSIREVSQIVTTTALPDMALAVWLRNDPPKTGHDGIDQLAERTWTATEGVTLKMRTESTVTGKKGKQQSSWTEFVVTELDANAGGPPDGYGYPESYTRTSMMPTEEELAGQEQGEDEGKKKRFGGLFDGGS